MKRSGFKRPTNSGFKPRSTWMPRGKALASGKGPAGTRKPIAQQSAKRAGETEQRRDVRVATFERDHYRCVAAGFVPGIPCAGGLECDEIQGRGREPGSHLDADRTQSLCPWCHRLKTDHPRIAGLLGLYGVDELERRLMFEEPGAMTAALAEWANRKAQLEGSREGWGGNEAAVVAFVAERGGIIPMEAWA